VIIKQSDTRNLYVLLKQLIKDIEFDELTEHLSCISHFNDAKKLIEEIAER